MKNDIQGVAARFAPVVFVVLWSTGFIGTKYVLAGAEPFTYLALRMAIVVAIMAVVVAIVRPQWPDRRCPLPPLTVLATTSLRQWQSPPRPRQGLQVR